MAPGTSRAGATDPASQSSTTPTYAAAAGGRGSRAAGAGGASSGTTPQSGRGKPQPRDPKGNSAGSEGAAASKDQDTEMSDATQKRGGNSDQEPVIID